MKGLQLTKQGFEDEWWKLVQTGLGYTEAYRQLEEWHMLKFGEYRYSSYISFYNTRSRRSKNQQS